MHSLSCRCRDKAEVRYVCVQSQGTNYLKQIQEISCCEEDVKIQSSVGAAI